ncbi:hypothetical protein [Campylobacter pinnipediorum]|uniref:hypothetical protein n=1 Tax=Campylobacter pinnipediorum TaxID=1965231 RepID=UPI0013017C5B|nr:hypothetical protein [Campylobacter pinnipediorum]
MIYFVVIISFIVVLWIVDIFYFYENNSDSKVDTRNIRNENLKRLKDSYGFK